MFCTLPCKDVQASNKMYSQLTRPFLPLFLLFLSMILTPILARAQEGSLTWQTNPEHGMNVMLNEGRPGVLCFFTPGSRPVLQMQQETFLNPEVQSEMKDLVPIAVDVRQYKKQASDFQILRVPTILLMDPQGREVDRVIGSKSPRAFMQYLKRFKYALANSGGERVEAFQTAAVDVTEPGEYKQKYRLIYQDSDLQGKTVFLTGDFNDWRETAVPMDQEGNMYTKDVYLELGQIYEYMYYIPDVGYRQDPRNPLGRVNVYGTVNSIMVAGTVRHSPIVNGNDVLFTANAPDASDVRIAGSFNNWQQVPMYRNKSNPNLWGARITLPRGRYFYKYIVDGEWRFDSENFTPRKDSGGNYNSSFDVQ